MVTLHCCFNIQALDTLGNTKWRVNKRILSVVESIWAAGGNIAGLVNREDVSELLILVFIYLHCSQILLLLCVICFEFFNSYALF